MEALRPFLATLASGRPLTRDEAEAAFQHILAGDANSTQLAAFVMGLRVRGETVDEIVGAVAAMRGRMLRVTAPPDAIDIVGTGGDGHGTYNVSTLAAIIAAACGVPVAKHGNRAASSLSGSVDVLGALGIATDLDVGALERCLATSGIAFMSARSHHPAMRHAAAVRSELGFRTIFNLLGPLSNPAEVKRLVVGVFSRDWLEPLARVLGALGAERAWLVHGSDGLDEITTTGPTNVVEWHRGACRHFVIDPEELGLPRACLVDLQGGDPAQNAAALRRVLAGGRGPYRDIACLNAAAALVVAERVADLAGGLACAQAALDNGVANTVLDRVVQVSQAARSADAALVAAS